MAAFRVEVLKFSRLSNIVKVVKVFTKDTSGTNENSELEIFKSKSGRQFPQTLYHCWSRSLKMYAEKISSKTRINDWASRALPLARIHRAAKNPTTFDASDFWRICERAGDAAVPGRLSAPPRPGYHARPFTPQSKVNFWRC